MMDALIESLEEVIVSEGDGDILDNQFLFPLSLI